MDDPTATKRRRLLEGISVGGATLLAGCTDQLALGGDGTDEQMDSGSDAGADGVAAIAAIDQEAIQEEQAELRTELRNGNISREEAQEELATLQEKYLEEAMSALGETAEATEGVTVEDEYRSLGAVIVTGDPGAILGFLNSEDVSALVPRADVEERAQGTATAQN